MCCSKTKKWIIGLLLLAAVVAVICYVVSMKEGTSQNKGTLVQSVKDGGELLQEKLKDGSMFLCEKISKAARKI
ncbi:hypothetical protein [Qiania dongpingensis]|uniref:Uncharacterized protein n=1 Tax=Qiania dongpingensis TaxID=2763669 RepID=A0A7G9G7K3_9FIRM|nr:hypothetical protein [Qiania dongpingensis]QNM06785.1 hypothetical protein H9Q78_06635 [Qiania dongpingensis]